jgi:Uma2 family endonuclease
MNAIPKLATFTADEFDLMARRGDFARKPKVELLDGVIFEMNAQAIPHVQAKMALAFALKDALASLPGLAVAVEASVRLSATSVPSPDIIIWDQSSKSGFVPVESVRLVIEISDSTLRFDLGQKRALYAAANIPEYWVVDVDGKIIHQRAQALGESYTQIQQVAFGASVQAMTVPGLMIHSTTLIG